jgi:phage shock protein PspC (stress-responsive transcriptional regulator)
MDNVENMLTLIVIVIVLFSFATLFLLYFVLKLIRQNQKLIKKERPEMLKEVKKLLKK